MTFVKLLLCGMAVSCGTWGMETSTKDTTQNPQSQEGFQSVLFQLPPELELGKGPDLDLINSQQKLDEYAAWFHELFYTFIEKQLAENRIKFGFPETQSPYWKQDQKDSKAFVKNPGVQCGQALESLLQNPLTIDCHYALRLSERYLLRKLWGEYMDKDVSKKEEFQRLVLGKPFGAPITLDGSLDSGSAWRPENLAFIEESLETLSLGARLYANNILGYQVLKDYDDSSMGENLFKIKNGKLVGFGGWFENKEWPTLQDVFDHLINEYKTVCHKPVTQKWTDRLGRVWPQHFSKEKLQPYLEGEKNRYEVMAELFPTFRGKCFIPQDVENIDSFFPVDQKDEGNKNLKFCFMPDPSLSNNELQKTLEKTQTCLEKIGWRGGKLNYEALKKFLENAREKELEEFKKKEFEKRREELIQEFNDKIKEFRKDPSLGTEAIDEMAQLGGWLLCTPHNLGDDFYIKTQIKNKQLQEFFIGLWKLAKKLIPNDKERRGG